MQFGLHYSRFEHIYYSYKHIHEFVLVLHNCPDRLYWNVSLVYRVEIELCLKNIFMPLHGKHLVEAHRLKVVLFHFAVTVVGVGQ